MVRLSAAGPGALTVDQLPCVGTLLAEDTVLTAAHCITEQTTSLVIECRLGKSGTLRRIAPIRQRAIHDTLGVALVRWRTHDTCRPDADTALLGNTSPTSLLFSVLEDPERPTLRREFTVGIVSVDQSMMRVEDAQACLQADQAGYPFFRYTRDGLAQLDAVLLSGNEQCPAVQELARLNGIETWVRQTFGPM